MSVAPLPLSGAEPRLAIALPSHAVIRACALALVAVIGAGAWSALVPAGAGVFVAVTTLLAPGAFAGRRALARIQPGARRWTAALGLAAALLGLVLAATGVPLRLLLPDRWGMLAGDLANAISALPAVQLPYHGEDGWIRAALLLGAPALAAFSGVLAAGHAPGHPNRPLLGGAIALGVLYGVAVVEVPPGRPYLSGALFATALIVLLLGERVAAGAVIPALLVTVLATACAAALGPVLDSDRPWIDLQRVASDIANRGTVGYRWDHDYGPLRWPRTGRELLRITTSEPTYWKTEVLDTFDGRAWRRRDQVAPFEPDVEPQAYQPRWYRSFKVRDVGLRSRDLVTAGSTLAITRAQAPAVDEAGGTAVLASGRLGPGSTYSVRSYVPQPSQAELVNAGIGYPSFARQWLRVRLPARGSAVQPPGRPAVEITFPPYGSNLAMLARVPRLALEQTDGERYVRQSGLGRIYALALRLRHRSITPYAFVRAVSDRVQSGARYTERPRSYANALDAFLFDDRRGYCQHFSGAMALLLRMGGIPARVATGFSPGQFDRQRHTATIRDLDAHSWVEAYFPLLGWITFDPTPGAAPARQAGDSIIDRPSSGQPVRGLRGSAASQASAHAGGGRWPAALGAAALVLLALGSVIRRRRGAAGGDPQLAELERALRRTGRRLEPATTLAQIEQRVAGEGAASAYLRALALRRYGSEPGPGPTAAERRALRTELAYGLGLAGRARAWLALPPRRPRLGWRGRQAR